jgi:dimethylaniline monooxygenase (N-oxide forming)
MEKKVAIIGAGVSGLGACKHVLAKGFHPVVFESRSGLGGVWSKTIKSTKLQSPKSYYQFSDFPWPDSVKTDYPTQQQVLEYVQSYTEHFGLLNHIKFNTKVVSLQYEGSSDEEMQAWSLWSGTGEPFSNKGKWNITIEDTETLLTEVYQFDFVILCSGMFSDVPNFPEFPPNKGPSAFYGKVLHSKDYSAMDNETAAKFVKGKRVVVVGFHKSALDIAMECSTANGTQHPCTVIYKNEHWHSVDHSAYGISLQSLFLNRFSELFFHKPGEGYLASIFATLFYPAKMAMSRIVESDLKRKIPMAKYGMVPKHSFLDELNTCTNGILPEKFYDRVEEGSIKLKKSQSLSFSKDGLILDSDENALVEADLVIFATGFRGDIKLKETFECKRFQDLMIGSSKDSVPLYRGCIHPKIPQLAVVGFLSSVGALYTAEMQSRWVTELLDGKFKAPSVTDMVDEMTKWDEFMKKHVGNFYTRSCFMLLHIFYNDVLCKDMGWNPNRKKGLFSELFDTYGPTDYASP